MRIGFAKRDGVGMGVTHPKPAPIAIPSSTPMRPK